MQGLYFFADFETQQIWSFRFDGSDVGDFDGTNVTDFTERTGELTPDVGSIDFVTGFGEDAAGNLYIVDHGAVAGEGEVFRVVGPAGIPLPIPSMPWMWVLPLLLAATGLAQLLRGHSRERA